jgi:hypothetical protein
LSQGGKVGCRHCAPQPQYRHSHRLNNCVRLARGAVTGHSHLVPQREVLSTAPDRSVSIRGCREFGSTRTCAPFSLRIVVWVQVLAFVWAGKVGREGALHLCHDSVLTQFQERPTLCEAGKMRRKRSTPFHRELTPQIPGGSAGQTAWVGRQSPLHRPQFCSAQV